MEKTRSLKIGILGCGNVTRFAHIPSIKRIKTAVLAAVSDIDPVAAKKAAQRANIPNYYIGLSEMLKHEHLDIVHICTPPDSHSKLSIEAMEAGCNVLVEKPMALNTQEADEMIQASYKFGVKLSVDHNLPLHPLLKRAKSLVAKGYIGEPTGLDVKYLLNRYHGAVAKKEHWCHNLRGGIFTNKLSPPLSLVMAFLSNPKPVAVDTFKNSDRDWLKADDLRVVLQGDEGMATITLSTNCPKDIFILSIFGTKRNLYIHLNNAVMYSYGMANYGRLSVVFENFRQGMQIFSNTASAVVKTALRKHHFGHYALIRGFIDSVQNDTEPPVTAEEGKESITILENIISQL